MRAFLVGLGVLAMAGAVEAAQVQIPLLHSLGNAEDANLYPSIGYNDHNGTWLIGLSGWLEGLIRFDLPDLGAGAVVDSAKVQLYGGANGYITAPLPVTAYALLRNWSEANVTWTNYDTGLAWGAEGALGVGTDHKSASAGTVTFSAVGYTDLDITTQYQQWYSGSEANHGLILLADSSVGTYEYIGDVYGTANPVLVVDYHAVPEPTIMSLLGIGGLLMLRRRTWH